ncbi:MFS transporter [Micromonospora sp. WMMD1102]|uniref:MFS transporter n=1 Tax=Micromonospora sp. WMMD1102 TaxID=3016105 RepID=UPI00241559CF|nr:MFS transporter [Micromonospora sp. WMMD1102]MDG4785819.1 MFS transporter [Micromonospora sp. WMMD1102]
MVLVVLFAGAFAMGSAEMLVMGIIDLVAVGLAVSLPAAGVLITAFALGVALGGPLLALLTASLDRRVVLLGAAATFVLLNLVPVLVADYSLFIVARAAVGAVQGLFIAAALTTAAGIVPADRAGRAMATVISGFAAASALGLPLGALVGRTLGWRASFAGLVILGSGVFLAIYLVLPSVPSVRESRARTQLRHAFAPRVLAVLVLCGLVFVAVQSTLTYLVPYLRDVTGVSGTAVTGFLIAFGVATTVGTAAGGRLADSHAERTLKLGCLGMTISLLAMYLSGARAGVALVAVIGIGAFAMGLAPALQTRTMSLAGPGAALAASLPASAASGGDAIGAMVGAVAIGQWGIPAAVLAGAVVALTAVAVAVATGRLHHPVPPSLEDTRRAVEPVPA